MTEQPEQPKWTSPSGGDGEPPTGPAPEGDRPQPGVPADGVPPSAPPQTPPQTPPPGPYPQPEQPPYGGPQQYGQPQYGQPQYGQPQPGPDAYGAMPYGGAGQWGGPPIAPKPGVIPLRPLGLGEILDGAISYIRKNPKTTLGLSAVVAVVIEILRVPTTALAIGQLEGIANSGANTSQAAINAVFSGFGSQFVGAIIAAVGVVVLTGLLIVVLGHAVIGRTMALGEVWAAVRTRIPGLLGITAVTTIALLGIMAAGFLPALFLLLGENGGAAALLLLITLPLSWGLMVYLGTSWALAPSAYILEGIPAMAALRRSRQLVNGSWWRTFGILLVAGLIAWIISVVVAVPFGIVQSLMTGAFANPDPFAGLSIGSLIIGAVASIIATTLTSPFMAGATGLLYFDQRIRKEAFDIQLTREAAQ